MKITNAIERLEEKSSQPFLFDFHELPTHARGDGLGFEGHRLT